MTQTWKKIVDADPGHSQRYAKRWDDMVAEGVDIDGEARLIDAMAPRGARILDAGCGQGRTGAYLHERGHTEPEKDGGGGRGHVPPLPRPVSQKVLGGTKGQKPKAP